MKFLFSLLTIFFIGQTAFASPNPRKLATKAGRSLTNYFVNKRVDSTVISKAKTMIDEAVKLDTDSTHFMVFYNKGRIYNEIALNSKFTQLHPFAEKQAYWSLRKAFDLAEKNYEYDLLRPELQSTASLFEKKGEKFYEERSYTIAYDYFSNIIAINNLFKENKLAPLLDSEEKEDSYLTNQVLSAIHIDSIDQHKEEIEYLYSKKVKAPGIYDALYTIYSANELGKAKSYLSEGRTLFPNDLKLIERDINLRLQEKDYSEKTIDLMNTSLVRDAGNNSLRIALANIYFKNHQNGNDPINSFQVAEKEYKTALKYNKYDYFGNLNLGLLYFNNAALLTKGVNPSTENWKVKKDIDEQFTKALFYLERFEEIDAKHPTALKALLDIYTFRNKQEEINSYNQKIAELN